MGKIVSIVLAAGESRRMGSPKMLLELKGSTIIENVISHVADSLSEGTIVVLGAYSDEIESVVKKYAVQVCYNDNFSDGMLSSVQCGIRNLPDETAAVLVFQGDQPFISSETIDKVINAYRLSDKGIVLPVYQGKRGHPLLLDAKYMNEVGKLDELVDNHIPV